MFKLEKPACASALVLYRSRDAFFPLIGAVLTGEQDGSVFGDSPRAPTTVYVEHAFGFAQVFGSPNPAFEAKLKHYWLHDQGFAATKIRLYTPRVPDFLDAPNPDVARSERQRFIFDDTSPHWSKHTPSRTSCQITGATSSNLASIDEALGVVRRFWRSGEDFIAGANAVVAWLDNTPVAICYAAAVSDRQAEIDVVTLPQYRRAGFGEAVVRSFIGQCQERGIAPVWDCFTNNAGSLGLCHSCGFVPGRPAYPFFTINKHSS